MSENPVLNKLGFSRRDRIVIFHADDIGCCQASVDAYADLVEFGLLSSAATMVPCPWFSAVAAYCRANQDNRPIDMGVHLTLTSEYDTYRWGPISTRQQTSGMLDEEGYFYRTSAAVHDYANPVAVQREMEAQIERAREAGIDITHIDSHMGTVLHPKFLAGYVALALHFRVPAFLIRWHEERLQQRGFDQETAQQLEAIIGEAESDGLPLFDDIVAFPLGADPSLDERMDYVKNLLKELRPGLTNIIMHPVRNTPEVHAMTTSWPRRANDRELMCSEELRDFVKEQGIHVIGYRALKEILP